MTDFHFEVAERHQSSLLIGLAGPSSSGKTYSALRLATGLANGGMIAMIDTESGRGLHYADDFTYQHTRFDPPFSPDRYRDAVVAAAQAKAKVIIIDSMSHEHEGQGGILEMHEAELERMAGSDLNKRERVKFSAWIRPKRQHTLLVSQILQLNLHVICCFRAKKKIEMVKVGKKTEIVERGWTPICSDRFEYEMTMTLLLPPNSEGKPDLSAESTKVQKQHLPMVKASPQIDETLGRALGAWAAGVTEQAPEKPAAQASQTAKSPESPATPSVTLSRSLIEVEADIPAFCHFFGVKEISELPSDRADEAFQMIEKKRKARAAR